MELAFYQGYYVNSSCCNVKKQSPYILQQDQRAMGVNGRD